jgi:hypothetical protein
MSVAEIRVQSSSPLRTNAVPPQYCVSIGTGSATAPEP